MSTVVARVRGLPSVQVTLAIALLVLGFLIAAQVAGERPRTQYSTQERTPLIGSVLDLQAQQEKLKSDILGLRSQIGDLEAQDPGAADSLRRLYADLEGARLAAGLIPITGPGVAFKLEDGTPGAGIDALVSARDVRVLVEELWLAGAEGIAINGERLSATSAVIDIGGSMLLNSSYLPPPDTIRAAEPTQLIANLTTGNDQLRAEVTELQDQRAHLAAAHDRGGTTVDELAADLARIRAWAGLTPVTGQGVAIVVHGPIGGDGVEDLINELRNAGAEAISVDGVRIVIGVVVAGAPESLSVENHAIGDSFEIRAIGSPQILTGTLTRTGGVIAQIGTAYPTAQLTVTPLD